MNQVLEIIKENNLKEINEMENLLPETKKIMIEYVNKFGILPSIMKITDYNNKIYVDLMKEAIEDDLPITYEDIEKEFKYINWDTIKK